MPLQEYIAETDITHNHIKSFVGTAELAGLIVEANEHYEEVAAGLEIDATSIAYPINITARQYLKYYITYRFAEDSIGCNGAIATDDIYLVLMNEIEPKMLQYRAKLTYDQITGNLDPSMRSRTISFGKCIRS
jgi:hypothetical protein